MKMNRLSHLFVVCSMSLLAVACQPISYTTNCGQGEFSFEPYPSRFPTGLPTPIHRTDADAHCLSPGSEFGVQPLGQHYGEIASIDRVELMVYHRRWDNVGGFWDVLADPDFVEITDFALTSDGNLKGLIPTGIAGAPPTAADLRMTYTDGNGVSQVVRLEEDRRNGPADHKLFFVPTYRVFLGVARVDIGFDALDRTVTGTTFPTFAALYPNGWEAYCLIRGITIRDSGFPGEVKFWDIPAGLTSPNQGYSVEMPSGRTGSFDLQYQVVCPRGLEPSGSNLFMTWSDLSDYLPAGTLDRGLPAISEIEYPPDSWIGR